MKLLGLLVFLIMIQQLSFKDTQLQHSRVKEAYREKENTVKNYFLHKNLNYQGAQIFLRAFKQEMKLEVWVKPKLAEHYSLLHTYDFCSTSGALGPKRKEGDLQIPEGLYHINHFNPQSNFHLSLGINYPNRADRILGDKHPGGAIYIHGNCVTIGCIPITDDKIKELYILAVEARHGGQQKLPVHIFPARLDEQGLKELEDTYATHPEAIKLWKTLHRSYCDFEATRTLKEIRISAEGEYLF